MHSSNSSSRRRRDVVIAPETLETRELLTGGAGNTFAIVPGEVTKVGQVAEIKFTIDPTHFTMPKGRMTLGIDVVANSGSTVKPKIVSIHASSGAPVAISHGVYDKHLPKTTLASGPITSAVQATLRKGTNSQPVTYTIDVKGLQKTTGKFLLGFYLPGDANGDGVVNTTDGNVIAQAYGTNGTQSTYSFDADANRDGRITYTDMLAVKKNMGVSTTITPVITANLDTSADPQLAGRVTTHNTIHLTGSTSPGAVVTFSDSVTSIKPVSATADSSGNYSIVLPLAPGANTFQVTSADQFGQSISGTIAPVTYQTNSTTQVFTALKQTPVVTKT